MSWQLVSQGPSQYFAFTAGAHNALYSTKQGQDDLIETLEPVLLKQTHSSVIIDIDSPGERTGDGLISRRGQCIGVKIADCLPVYLFTQKTICIIHCGWRGITAGIARRAKDLLRRYRYVLGASIGPCCYEVEEDVAARFAAHYPGAVTIRESRYYLDLKSAVTADLGSRNLLGTLDLCTKCHPGYFYSHRRGDDGRNYALITA
ncbi:polyphenol oxidase family protein [candidate division WOR-3 bacterium]|nr:polyphenol oxidase family protein [candidate division WOR-3 bacterium]